MKKKIVLGIVVFVVLLLGIRLCTYKDFDERIRQNVISLGYKSEDKEGITYYKQLSDIGLEQYYVNVLSGDSEYDSLFFNTSTYEFMENKFQTVDGVELNFIPVYDYKTGELTYTYRMVYETSNVIFKGEYDISNGQFICEKSYAHDIEIFDSEDIVCENAKNNIKDFVVHIESFVVNPKFLEYMKKKNISE